MLQITALFFYKHFIFDLYEKVIFQTVICIVCDKIFFPISISPKRMYND